MKTVVIQAGNSDDRLPQLEWSHYVDRVYTAIEKVATKTHFFGGSPNWHPWQNVAWVIACDEAKLQQLKEGLGLVQSEFKQDSIAWTEGNTIFL